MGGSSGDLGAECAALLQLLGRYAMGFGAKGEKLLGDANHLAGALELVVGGFDADFDFVFDAGEIFAGFGKLRIVLGERSALAAAVEDVVTKDEAESSEVVLEKRDAVLIALAREDFGIGDKVALGEAYGGRGFFHVLLGFLDFGMRGDGELLAFFEGTRSNAVANGGIER